MVSVVRNVVDPLFSANEPQLWLEQVCSSLIKPDAQKLQMAFNEARALYAEDKILNIDSSLFVHAVGSAAIIHDLNLQLDAVIASLLFAIADYREDWRSWVNENFGASVETLIDGVCQVQRLTEIANIDHLETEEEKSRQAEIMRKMLLAMVGDIRVVLINLAWRTQTMQTLHNCQEDLIRKHIAQETMDIFAPLANRLGVWQIKWELEDLSFRYLHPKEYRQIASLLEERRLERIDYIDNVLSSLRQELAKAGIKSEVAGRAKHIFSIWKKMSQKKLEFSELYDIRAVRILVEKLPDCYSALGLIHGLWQPISGEFDDYISHPKANNYRSLHTAVIGPQDKALEVQIRTFEMHEHAEFGVAAHWRYKEGGKGDAAYEEKIAWLRQLLDWREEMADFKQSDLSEAFKTELFTDTIYVLTPAGKVISLPSGATPIDFAYALHSDLGNRCRGAKIEGQIVPLSTALQNGQRVEILAAKKGEPSINWLHDGWVVSHKAISKIRQYIRQQNADNVRENGAHLLERELAKHQHQPNLQVLSEQLGFSKISELNNALGHGDISLNLLSRTINKLKLPIKSSQDNIVKRSKGQVDTSGILVDGVSNLLTTLAKCCKPAPPDGIIGFVTRGRGVAIHRRDCSDLKSLTKKVAQRLVAVDWGATENGVYPIDLEVFAHNRANLLRDISDALSRSKINVIAFNTLSRDPVTRMQLTIEVSHVRSMQRIIDDILAVADVTEVHRL